MTAKKKIVLAYSGGLDTSVILKWLVEQDYEVIAYLADVGQKEDFEAARKKALAVGASKVYVEDLKKPFVTDYIFPNLKSNAIYENRYMLGTSVARPIIAKTQVEIARKENAQFVGHGATGKGNDQVRFELGYAALGPDLQVIAPWKTPEFLERFRGRTDMLQYAEQYGIPVTATRKKPYSEDENLLHISHEAGILEDPAAACDESVYSWTQSPETSPNTADIITITYEKGIPVKVENKTDGHVETDPLKLFLYLNDIGGKHGIGRLDMVENRYVGIKSRGVYETPAGTIIHNGLRDLEGLTMDRQVLRIRDQLSLQIAEVIYYGYWFSPEMEMLTAAIDVASKNTSGTVDVKLFKGVAYPIARQSPNSLYSQDLSSMDDHGGFNQMDSQGFIRVNGIRLKMHALINNKDATKKAA